MGVRHNAVCYSRMSYSLEKYSNCIFAIKFEIMLKLLLLHKAEGWFFMSWLNLNNPSRYLGFCHTFFLLLPRYSM